jgi:hypothetical protein
MSAPRLPTRNSRRRDLGVRAGYRDPSRLRHFFENTELPTRCYRRPPIRASIDFMTIFVALNEHELTTTAVEMWSEVFIAWAALHGRIDEESAEQLGEYEEFLRASIWHLKQVRDAPRDDREQAREGKRVEAILTGIFGRVAGALAFAERKIAGGKMPSGMETAVLEREKLVRLLDDDAALLDEALKREHKAL